MKEKKSVVTSVLLFLGNVFMLLPLYLMFVGSLKTNKAMMGIPPDFNLFGELTLDNFRYVFERSDILQWLLNSFIISGGTALLTVLVASMAGYSFAKIRFRGKNLLFSIVIATMIMPRQILVIPNFLVADSLNLTNKIIGVILTSVMPAFGIFLCRQFMQTIPSSLMDAAEIDGCTEFRKFWNIIVPLSLPAMASVGVLSFFTTFNDYLWQLVMLSDPSLQTLPNGIALFSQKMVANNGAKFAAATIATVRLVILFLCCQKFFIKGITMGGVKE